MYYFAYGSNMNLKQMKKRCGLDTFKPICKAYLPGYKFLYDGYSHSRGGAVANIVESENSIVWGALYHITKECLQRLDKYEGYPTFYKRKEVTIKTDDEKEYLAWVYYRESEREGEPPHEYRQIILEGAKNWRLPDDYIEKFLKAGIKP